MRLPLTLLALCAAAPASAGTRADAWTSDYAGDDRVHVVSSAVGVKSELEHDVSVEAGYDVDVITAASVDVVTAASPRGYSEVRQGGELGATWKPAPLHALDLELLPSFEPDYLSRIVAVGESSEWFDRRLTTRASYRLSLDEVGRHGAPDFRRPLDAHAFQLEAGWVADPKTVVSLTYELRLERGFLASPYRYVRIEGAEDGVGPAMALPENVPDARNRQAASLSARHAFAGGWFATLGYRFGDDDWQVANHTVEGELQRVLFGDQLVLGLSARGYAQSAASFQKNEYRATGEELPLYRSMDKLLAKSWSVLVGARAEWTVVSCGAIRELRLVAKVEWFEQRFEDFALLSRRGALIGSVGAAAFFGETP